MILPNKYVSDYESLLGVGSVLLDNMTGENSLSILWERVKKFPNIGNFERYVLGLDLLFLLGLIDIKEDRIFKVGE